MSDAVAVPEAVNPPAVSVREIWPWGVFAIALLGLVYLVSMGGGASLHEWVHDGRHLLGFPCH